MYPNINEITAKALEAGRAIFAAGPTGMLDVRKDITSSSGFAAYDLQPIAINLQPVITPLRNQLPRVQNTRGGNSTEWRYISSLINGGTFDPFPGNGTAATKLNYSATPKTAAFAEIGVGDSVQWAALDGAKGFENDLRARATANALYALMIIEEQALLMARISDLGTVTAPTVSASDTGGAVTSGTWLVKVRAIVGMGNGTNTRGKASSASSPGGVVSTSTGVITANTPAVPGAVAYEWYVNNGAAGTTYYLQATTGINSFSLATAVDTGAATLPADSAANANAFDGLIPQIYANAPAGNILTLATGADGVGTDFQLADLDKQNKFVWDNAKASPEDIWMHSTQLIRATNLVLAANGGATLFVKAESDDMAKLTGGYALAKYVNKATGRIQNVRIHPNMPEGLIMATSGTIPFPTGGDQVGIDIETSREYQQVDYAVTPATGRAFPFEVYSREVVRLKFTGGAWLVGNCSAKQAA